MIDNSALEWKPIPGSLYNLEISNYGDIRSRWGYRDSLYRFRRPFIEYHTEHPISEYGYRYRNVKGASTRLVHRLVALAFLPEVAGKNCINHKDGNKLNNFVGTAQNGYTDGNLEWCTAGENALHAYNTGLVNKKRLQETILMASGALKQPILQLDLQGNVIARHESAMEASRKLGNVSFGDIARVARGEGKSAFGFQWIYEANYDVQRIHVYSKRTTGKPVAQYSLDGALLAKYPSTNAAASATGQRSGAHIAECCKGKRAHCGGYRWQWINK